MKLKCAGRFFICTYGKQDIFNKTYKSPKESIEILRERGLSITDESKAQHYLSHIGYYRLSAYMHPLLRMPKEEHLFKEGASFDKVMTLYRFEKKLRMLLFNEIEKIDRLKEWKDSRRSLNSTAPFLAGSANFFNKNGRFVWRYHKMCLPLQPQIKDGGIAQLVRAHDS